LPRPIWHQYSGQTQAHVLVCVLNYALLKTLGHLAKPAELETMIHRPDLARGNEVPKPRRGAEQKRIQLALGIGLPKRLSPGCVL
jgi:hypothetical protein